MDKFSAIIVAAGAGKRAGTDIPKQFVTLGGKPLLQYTLDAFLDANMDEIILVLPKGGWQSLESYGVTLDLRGGSTIIVEGGKERFDSVYEGLKKVSHPYVLIQDAARIFTSQDVIARCKAGVVQYDACVAAIPVTDTIKEADENMRIVKTMDRSKLWQMQTPQAFATRLLKEAYLAFLSLPEEKKQGITDDAMLIESFMNHSVQLIEGDPKNFKITTAFDLHMAKALLDS